MGDDQMRAAWRNGALTAIMVLAPGGAVQAAWKETLLYSFGVGHADGIRPRDALLYRDGALYGTTEQGGSADHGTVFKVDPATGAETVLYNFTGGADGANPDGGLIYQGGSLYGTTFEGGSFAGNCGAIGCGTVFKIDPSTGAETVIHSFTGGLDGKRPWAALIYEGGALFGTTTESSGAVNGGSDAGTVFKIDLATGAETVLHRFAGAPDGATPWAALIYQGGLLYGTTEQGGVSGNGTVFKVDPVSGAEMVLYSFTGGQDGGDPYGGLIYQGGVFFGTTSFGGQGASDCGVKGCGTVFKVDPTTGAETVIHSFTGAPDGATPIKALLFKGGALLGSTAGGGTSDHGSVFKIDPASGAEAVIYSVGADQFGATNELISQTGAVYGTTDNRGALGSGSVFKLAP